MRMIDSADILRKRDFVGWLIAFARPVDRPDFAAGGRFGDNTREAFMKELKISVPDELSTGLEADALNKGKSG